MEEAPKRGQTSIQWPAEPHLGGIYGEEEIDAVVKTMRDSMDNHVDGFGFTCEEVLELEADFGKYTSCSEVLSITNCANGLDMAMMALDLQPGDEAICPSLNVRAAPMSIVGYGDK